MAIHWKTLPKRNLMISPISFITIDSLANTHRLPSDFVNAPIIIDVLYRSNVLQKGIIYSYSWNSHLFTTLISCQTYLTIHTYHNIAFCSIFGQGQALQACPWLGLHIDLQSQHHYFNCKVCPSLCTCYVNHTWSFFPAYSSRCLKLGCRSKSRIPCKCYIWREKQTIDYTNQKVLENWYKSSKRWQKLPNVRLSSS